MTGVQGLGRHTIAGDPSPVAQALASDLDHLGVQVTPANVLQVRNALRGEAQRLGDLLAHHDRNLRVIPPAADPVSQAAAPLFNEKIDALVTQWRGYVDALRRAGLALEQTAREYGRTEQQITDSFDSYLASQRPGWERQAHERDALSSLPAPMRSLVQPGPPAPPPGLFPGIPGGPR